MTLPPWHENYGKRVVRAAKLFFLDPLVVSALTRQPDAASQLAGPLGGALFEGLCVSEARKAYAARGLRPDLHHWHSHGGLEVDLVLRHGGRLQPIEIKLTATPTSRHAATFTKFRALAGEDRTHPGVMICRVAEERRLPGGHWALPWQRFGQRLDDWLGEGT